MGFIVPQQFDPGGDEVLKMPGQRRVPACPFQKLRFGARKIETFVHGDLGIVHQEATRDALGDSQPGLWQGMVWILEDQAAKWIDSQFGVTVIDVLDGYPEL